MGEVWRLEMGVDDCVIALQAAQTMAGRLGVDIAIMPDLSVVEATKAQGVPLEVIRAGA